MAKIDYSDVCDTITFSLFAFYHQAIKDKEITLDNVDTFLLYILTQCFGLSKKEAKKIVEKYKGTRDDGTVFWRWNRNLSNNVHYS